MAKTWFNGAMLRASTYDLAVLFARVIAAEKGPVKSDTTDWCAFPLQQGRMRRDLRGLALSDSINAGFDGWWQYVVIDGRNEYECEGS